MQFKPLIGNVWSVRIGIITVLWRVVTAILSFGFGSAHTKDTTISLSNCDSRLAT
jgi:hypothetical protein